MITCLPLGNKDQEKGWPQKTGAVRIDVTSVGYKKKIDIAVAEYFNDFRDMEQISETRDRIDKTKASPIF